MNRYQSVWLLVIATVLFAFGVPLASDFTEQDSSESVVFVLCVSTGASATGRPMTSHVLLAKDSIEKIKVAIPEPEPPAPFSSQLLRC